MPGSDLRRNGARFPGSKAPKGVSSRQCRKVRSGCGPAGQNGRLRQQQHQRHGHHQYQGQSGRQGCPRTAFPVGASCAVRLVRSMTSAVDRPKPAGGSRCLAVRHPAVSLRVEARAVRSHGMDAPRGPPTRSVTVTCSHSPSAETAADADPPDRVRTILSTVAESSPRASARAPARAPSSSRNWVTPAEAPASSMASSSRTAGRVTANSAVTAPREPVQPRGPAAGPHEPATAPRGPGARWPPEQLQAGGSRRCVRIERLATGAPEQLQARGSRRSIRSTADGAVADQHVPDGHVFGGPAARSAAGAPVTAEPTQCGSG
jgi:hypothetical protein